MSRTRAVASLASPSGEQVVLTADEETARDTEDTADAIRITAHKAQQYQRDRATAYPRLADQMDAIWKGGQEEAAMRTLVAKIKADHPKP